MKIMMKITKKNIIIKLIAPYTLQMLILVKKLNQIKILLKKVKIIMIKLYIKAQIIALSQALLVLI